MFNKKTLALMIISVTTFNAHAALQSFDARSHGMGGVGVASSDYLTASFHNPALAAKYHDSDDFGLLLPAVGAQVFDGTDMIKRADDFSNIYDNFKADPSDKNGQAVINSLKDFKGNRAFVQGGVGAAISIPNKYLSVNLFSKVYADAFVMTDIADKDLNVSTLDPDNLKSRGVAMGVAIAEGGATFAKSYETKQGTFYVGVSPKYQHVQTINYSATMDNYTLDDFDNDKYITKDANINLDAGIAYQMAQGFTIGLSGRNLISQSYETKLNDGIQGVYKMNPVYTVGASFTHPLFTVAVDVDLNENERYESITGLNNSVNASDDNTQMAGVGLEFNAWDWAQLRAGYQYDITGNTDGQLTAGVGISPFGAVHLDVSANYGGDNQFGAVVQSYFTF